MAGYTGEAKPDFYGRLVPRHAHGTYNLKKPSSLTSEISHAVTELFDNIVNPDLFIRRITINVNHIVREKDFENSLRQLDLFSTTENTKDSKKEKRQNEAILAIKKRYGRNAILKGINFEEGATGRERNAQIGGHKA